MGEYVIKSDLDDYTKTEDLSEVALTGEYDDLLNKPELSEVATTGEYNDLLNKPSLSEVATSGSYNDLSNKPNLANFGSVCTAKICKKLVCSLANDFISSSFAFLDCIAQNFNEKPSKP